MWIKALLAGGLFATAAQAQVSAPLSAIDWLSDSVSSPSVQSVVPGAPGAGAEIEVITVAPLGQPRFDAVGLLPSGVTGLPRDLWGPTPADQLARQISAAQSNALPTTQRLLTTLLLAELDPPAGDGPDGRLFLARIDKLLEMGALDQAQALLERAGPTDPALFRRWFDVSLLTGHEDRACAAMRATPGIAPTFPARIFCLARGNDWNAAALTLETGKALGFISDAEDALLIRFLDPEFAEEGTELAPPQRPSPLVFRMFEAIGTPLPTTNLPLAFANADLRDTTGWRAQIEAAERLARGGVIAPNHLLGIFTARSPAASGGVWDRVAALQDLDVALLARDAEATARTLTAAWDAAVATQIEGPFAALYGERLSMLDLPGAAGPLAFRIGLLSEGYETVANDETPDAAFLAGIARGAPPATAHPDTPMANALIEAFGPVTLSTNLQRMLDSGELGAALLQAMELINTGSVGEPEDARQGIALLRRLGLEDAARRAALELMILERHG